MTTASSCTVAAFRLAGRRVAMIEYGSEPGRPARGRRCGDCGVEPGGFHHPGCDLQLCPSCRGQMMLCDCLFDEDGADEARADEDGTGVVGEPLAVDRNGVPVERVSVEGHEVIVRHDDIPDSDLTTVDGIPCTTALRTVIDIAPDVDPAHLELIVQDCLARQLFTVADARRRLAQPDMATRLGADLLGRVLPT